MLPFFTYFQDPFVARLDPKKAFDEVLVAWEPGLTDGPTSSRFAIVDYNADAGTLAPPAVWDEQSQAFVGVAGAALDTNAAGTFQFHQVSVWALLQCSLAFFEDGSALGRTIPWAFEGNRLIVVPHAGYGENAYYDRASKSLQFYYFGSEKDTVYTCLSTDIVHHEFGHAVLDGIRPLFNESSHPQTAAFHEFMGDLTAILLTLKNDTLRRQLAAASGGKFEKADDAGVARRGVRPGGQGPAVPAHRAATTDKMSDMVDETSPHRLSEVLTGAMFDVLIALGERYQERGEDDAGEEPTKKKTPIAGVLGRRRPHAADGHPAARPAASRGGDVPRLRPGGVPLAAALRSARPGGLLRHADQGVSRSRDPLGRGRAAVLREPRYLYDRLDLSVRHSIDDISRSRAAAYRFLDDNREDLLIPASRDFFVADLYDAKKRAPAEPAAAPADRPAVRLARGGPAGRPAVRPVRRAAPRRCCAAARWCSTRTATCSPGCMKPGSEPYGGKRTRRGKKAEEWAKAVREGDARKAALLDHLAAQIAAGRIGTLLGSPKGLLASHGAADDRGGRRGPGAFPTSPHLHLSSDEDVANDSETGERQWEISC